MTVHRSIHAHGPYARRHPRARRMRVDRAEEQVAAARQEAREARERADEHVCYRLDSLERALGECACVRDWDQGRAVRWWSDADRAPA